MKGSRTRQSRFGSNERASTNPSSNQGRTLSDYRNSHSTPTSDIPIKDLLPKSDPVHSKIDISAILDRSKTASEETASEVLSERDFSIESDDLSNIVGNQPNQMARYPQKLVQGSQFRMIPKEHQPCPNCNNMDKLLKRSKDNIRSLKLQISRLEDKIAELKRYQSGGTLVDGMIDLNATLTRGEVEDLKASKRTLQLRCDEMEVEIARLKKASLNDKLMIEELKNSLHQLSMEKESMKLQHLSELQRHSEDKDLWNVKKKEFTEENERLLQQIRELEALRREDQRKHSSHSVSIKDEQQTLKNEISRLTSLIDSLRSSSLQLESSLQNTHRKHGEEKIQWTKSQGEFEKQIKELEKQLKESLQQQSLLSSSLTEKDTYLLSLSSQLLSLQSQHSSLSDSHLSLQQTHSSLLSSSQSQREKQETQWKKLIESSLSSSIRLCVVAPTVNVTVGGGGGGREGGGGGDKKTHSFRSQLSSDTLRSFLSSEVLSKYSVIFQQEEEDSGPKGGSLSISSSSTSSSSSSSLQEWIERMLNNMQSSIEKHIQEALKS